MIFIGKMYNHYSYPGFEYDFSPSKCYPEYPFSQETISPEFNGVYDLIRNGFVELGLDKEHYGTQYWNPLRKYIKEGDNVVLKPNMVSHQNLIQQNGMDCLITHPSIIRTVIDYILIALKGTGSIVVADSPVQSCDFDKLLIINRYKQLTEFYRKYGIDIVFEDLRNCIVKKVNGIYKKVDSNLNESVIVAMNDQSKFCTLTDAEIANLRITSYDPTQLLKYHSHAEHKYSISQRILNADVVINIPKVKTHKKAGVTLSLKNMVGIVTDKTCLPHHRMGSVYDGGDEYQNKSFLKQKASKLLDAANRLQSNEKYSLSRLLALLGILCNKLGSCMSNDFITEGNWCGNDTIWRMVHDLNLIVRYADSNGQLHAKSQRRILNIADMVILGEGEGPLKPSPRYAGIIAIGEDSVSLDYMLCQIMGVNIRKIPILAHYNDIVIPQYVVGIAQSNNLFSIQNDLDGIRVENIKMPYGW